MDCVIPAPLMHLAQLTAPHQLTDDQLLMEMAFALGIDAGPCQMLGNLWGLFAATELQLVIAGFTATDIERIRLLRATCQRVRAKELVGQPVLSSWIKVLEYLSLRYASQAVESLTVLFLDSGLRLIVEREMQRGTVDHTPAYPREVAKAAIMFDSSAVLLAHNHPSGTPTPSAADIKITREVAAALNTVGVVLHDHVIVGAGGKYVSFKSAGLL